MTEIRDYVWAFPLTGGVIALIAILTPAAYITVPGNSMYVWMWGLLSIQLYGYSNVTQFTQDPGELIISIICSVLVLIGTFAIISSAVSCRKKMRMGIVKRAGWLIPSILLIIGTISWMIGMEINSNIFYGMSLWTYINPGFGVIGMFLGGAVSIVGYGVSKMKGPRREEIFIPMKKEFITPENEISIPKKEISKPTLTSFKFCPNCGQKIISQEQRFCTNCGFELRGIPNGKSPQKRGND